jgi:predicted type IV restriction endonuclease
MTLAISKHILNLYDVETIFHAEAAKSDRFFTEWHEHLPTLSESEKRHCDRIKERYLYHRHHGQISEGLVNQIVISPLLESLNFYDPPFLVQTEYPVELIVEQDGEVYRGRIDTLVIQAAFWVLVIESKSAAFNIEAGMAQALSYMLASPNGSGQPTYGLISNGGFSIFVKVLQSDRLEYAFSNDFSLYNKSQNELQDVFAILKQIGRQIGSLISQENL